MSDPLQHKRRRGPGRPFVKGAPSANPKGRPPGSRHPLTILAEGLLQDRVPDIVATVIAAAAGGDMVAAKLVLERVLPLRRGRPVYLADMPKIKCAADLIGAAARISEAVASGEITCDEAMGLSAVAEFSRRAIETADMDVRLSAMESRWASDGAA